MRYKKTNKRSKIRLAKRSASRKAKAVYRTNIKLPKKSIAKKFANFVGKSTFKKVLSLKKRR